MPDRPVPHYDSVEEEALAALADDADEDLCEECGEPGTEDGTYCYQCKVGLSNAGMLACPFCPQWSGSACAHLVLVVDGESGWIDVPVHDEDLPWLDDDGASPDAWTAGEIQAVFGDLAPLAEMYETPRCRPHIGEFYERLAGQMRAPVVVQDGINAMAVYSEHHRETARSEVEAIVQRLAQGFERLAARRRSHSGADAHA